MCLDMAESNAALGLTEASRLCGTAPPAVTTDPVVLDSQSRFQKEPSAQSLELNYRYFTIRYVFTVWDQILYLFTFLRFPMTY